MTQEGLKKLLKTLGIPIAYGTFDVKQTPPYALYYRDFNDNVYADNIVYTYRQHFILEVYTRYRDLDIERKIEELFAANDIPYEVEEEYLADQELRKTTYDFYIQGGKENGKK